MFADPSFSVGQANIDVAHSRKGYEPTKGHRVYPNNKVFTALKLQDAFLIVEGKRHISLNRPLLRIGRHIDNDIVIEDPAVSRRHAQIRFRYDRFIIQDLGSQAGIRVNGKQVTEHVLRDGDVITLSGAALIYGDGEPLTDLSLPRPSTEGQVTVAFSPDEEE
jgi:pSer/pThr/pTyr-binding forkhead associated (FHA) protein